MTSPTAPSFDGTQPCANDNPELWFASPRKELAAHKEALQGCHACRFIVECREYAVKHNVEGTWGGTTWPERKKHRGMAGLRAIPVTLPALMPALGSNQWTTAA